MTMPDSKHPAVQAVIDGCNSSAQNFHRSSREAHSEEVRALLERRAEECAEAANKLRLELRRASGARLDGGHSDADILEECAHVDEETQARFEQALRQPLPEPLQHVLQLQYEGVLRTHRETRALHERLRTGA